MSSEAKSDVLCVLSENRSQLMGLAMLSIMLFHQSFVREGNMFFALFHFCGHWGVDVFMLLSGMGCYFSYRKTQASMVAFYKRRFMRIIPCALCAGVFKIILLTFLFHSFTSNSWLILFGLDLWFIRSILILYLLFPFFQWVLQGAGTRYFLPILVVACMVFLSWFDSLQIHNALYYQSVAWTLYRLPIFVIGILIAKNGGKGLRINKWFSIVALSLLVFLLYHCVISKVYFPQYCFFLKDEYIYFLLVVPVVALSYCAGLFMHGGWPILRLIGIHSLELYLVHEFIYRLVEAMELPLWGSIQLILAVVLSFAAAYMLRQVVRRALKFVFDVV